MAQVLEFKKKQEDEEHLRGPARCLGCQHEWEAVAPVGVITSLECPECHLLKGTYIGLVEPSAAYWQCNCGSYLFFILPHCCQCLMCGKEQEGF